MEAPCRLLSHTADLKIEVEGKNWEEFWRRCAQSFSFLVLDRADFGAGEIEKKIELKGETPEEKVVNFFNDLIFLLESEGILPVDGSLKKEKFVGKFFRPQPSEIRRELKSATFHGLKVVASKNKISAQIIFDI
ncbi:archease [bacterium]|nr:archease [bacterium]